MLVHDKRFTSLLIYRAACCNNPSTFSLPSSSNSLLRRRVHFSKSVVTAKVLLRFSRSVSGGQAALLLASENRIRNQESGREVSHLSKTCEFQLIRRSVMRYQNLVNLKQSAKLFCTAASTAPGGMTQRVCVFQFLPTSAPPLVLVLQLRSLSSARHGPHLT
jgi:hypothetical protein